MEQYENVFFDSKSCLDFSIFMFQLSCRELVRDLPDKQIRDLVDLRQGWDDMELTEKLQRRLGEKYGKYRVLVRKLNKEIRLLQRKLKLREDLSVGYPTKQIALDC